MVLVVDGGGSGGGSRWVIVFSLLLRKLDVFIFRGVSLILYEYEKVFDDLNKINGEAAHLIRSFS